MFYRSFDRSMGLSIINEFLKAWYILAIEAKESESESESEESSKPVWINTTETSLSFKTFSDLNLALRKLGMSYVIGWFFYLQFWFRSTSSHPIASDGIRSEIGRKRKRSYPCDSDSVELTIAIPSPFFLFTLEWKVPYAFDSVASWKPLLSI